MGILCQLIGLDEGSMKNYLREQEIEEECRNQLRFDFEDTFCSVQADS